MNDTLTEGREILGLAETASQASGEALMGVQLGGGDTTASPPAPPIEYDISNATMLHDLEEQREEALLQVATAAQEVLQDLRQMDSGLLRDFLLVGRNSVQALHEALADYQQVNQDYISTLTSLPEAPATTKEL